VSVVAPWSFAENYENILKVKAFMAQLPQNDPTLKQTNAILQNIGNLLESQTNDSNQSVPIPVSSQLCKTYKPICATPSNLKY
jgi:hypothetical protein